jgi:uncharacterized protein YybS (DUF2232 family)
MPSKTKQLAENALLLAIALILLFVSLYTVLFVATGFLLPLPFVLLGMRRTVPNMIWIVLGFALLGGVLTGPMTGFIALLFGLWGGAMGVMYAKRGTALSAITAGAGVVFLGYVSFLALAAFVLHVDFQAVMREAAAYKPSFMTKEQFEQSVALGRMVMPAFLVMLSYLQSGITHGLARLIGKRLGYPVPALKPVREWSFPRSLLYYYVAALIGLFLIGQEPEGTFWSSAVLNVKVMLDGIFALQGLAFCLFAIHLYGWKRLAPALVVSLFIFPFLTTILSLLGIFDLGLQLRKKLDTRVKRG